VSWIDVIGWGGSALLIFSLLQARVFRFRVLNLMASLVLTVFNVALEIWPLVAMNITLSTINVWFIVRLLRDRHNEAAFDVLRVRSDDTYLAHVLRVHGEDIAKFQPDFTGPTPETADFLVQKGDETVGVVVLRPVDRDAFVDLDYVTPRFRDFSPGEFVWRKSGLLAGLGVDRVVTSPLMRDAYYDRVGFRQEGESWVFDVPSGGGGL
jgi:hypothetical protein